MPDKNATQTQNIAENTSVLSRVSEGQNLMDTAISLQEIAAEVGFDWPNIEPVFAKLDEEIQELKHEVEQSQLCGDQAQDSQKRLEDELGDVLFCCMNLARFLKVDPEKALGSTNNKFKQRFRFIESYVQSKGKKMQGLSLEELDKAWDLAKEQGL